MWTQSTMPFSQSVIVSGMGITVVFLTLVVLALAITAISKLLRAFIKDNAPVPAAAAAAVQPAVSDEADKETLAVLMAAIGLDLDLPPEQFKIVDVKEVR